MKREPAWLRVEAILAIHEQLVRQHGGLATLRDRGLLESALASPVNRFAYGETDVFALAAAYASGITRNHPFIDGNKRIAFMAAYVFLGVNGWALNAPEERVVAVMLGLSNRSLSESEFTAFLRESCVPRKEKERKFTRRRTGSRRRRRRGSTSG